MTESAKDAITAFILSSLYFFSCSLFFSSSSCILAYYSCDFISLELDKNYLKPLSLSLFAKPSLVFFIFYHDLMESLEFLMFSISHFLFFDRNFFLNLSHQQLIKFFLLLFLNFLPFVFILNLSISHFFLKFDFSLVFFFLFSLSLIIQSGLLLLESKILLTFFFFSLFLTPFLLHLLIELFLDFFFKLLLTHFFKLLLFLEKLCIKLYQSSPFIIVVSFNLVDRFRGH